MKSKKQINTMSMAEDWAAEYLKLKSQISALEEQLVPVKNQLKTYLYECTPQARANLAGREFFMMESTFESFDLKRARQKVSEKVLKPFVSLRTSASLRCK